MVTNSCMDIISHARGITLSQFESNESCHCHPGICTVHVYIFQHVCLINTNLLLGLRELLQNHMNHFKNN